MRYLIAVLCALAVVITQVLYGGAMRPVFALPGLFLVGVAGALGIVAVFWRNVPAPSFWAVSSVLVFAGWLIWRELESPDPWLAAGYLRLTLGCLVMYLVFACVVINPRHRLAFVITLLLCALVQVALAVWQFTRPESAANIPWLSEQLRVWYAPRWNWRGHGTYLNGNHLVWFLNASGIFALSLACWGRWGLKTKIVWLYLALASFGGVVVTLSRGGLVGFLVIVSAFLLLSAVFLAIGARDRRFVAVLVILAAVMLAGGLFFLVFQGSLSVQQRFRDLLTDNYRPSVFQSVTRQAQLQPFEGTGAGTFLYHGRQFREFVGFTDDIYAHNDWMQIAGDFGLPAQALLVLVVGTHTASGVGGFISILRKRRDVYSSPQSNAAALLIAALCSCAMFVAHSFFDFNMQIPANALLGSAVLGMLANPGSSSESRFPQRLWRRMVCVSAAGGGVYLVLFSAKVVGPEYFWLQAENAVLRGKIGEAVTLGKAGLSFGEHSRLERTVGDAYMSAAASADKAMRRHQFLREAEQYFQKSFLMVPLDASLALRLAEVRRLLPGSRRGKEMAISAILLNPTQGRAYELYGEYLEGEGRLSEAIVVYRIALQLPGSMHARQSVDELSKKLLILSP
jgi:hypothetical protein